MTSELVYSRMDVENFLDELLDLLADDNRTKAVDVLWKKLEESPANERLTVRMDKANEMLRRFGRKPI